MTSSVVNSRDDRFDAAPKGYTLQQLLFLHRHGERTIIAARFPEHVLNFDGECARTRAFSVVRSGSDELKFEERIIDSPHVQHHHARSAADNNCALGQLTDRGATTLETLGANLRARYVDQLQLLPKNFDSSAVLVQSTDVPRAIASARFLLSGLYPAKWRADAVPTLHIRKAEDEVIYPNWSHCPRLRQIAEEWRRTGSLHADMDEFKERIPVLFGLTPPPSPSPDAQPPADAAAQQQQQSVLMSQSRSTHAFFDENSVRKAHGKPLLPGSTPESVADAGKLSVREWFGEYLDPKYSKETCRIGVGPLFRDMLRHINSDAPPKAVIYSGHDTTIAPVLACVTAFDNQWPKYGSNVAFEVLKKDNTDEKFVQVRYNFGAKVMQACAPFAPKDAPTLCPMNRFLEIVTPMVPTNWADECKKR